MTYKTHFNFGILCSTLFTMYIYKGNANLEIFFLISGICALIPDADCKNAYINRLIAPIFYIGLMGYLIYKYHMYILITFLVWAILASMSKHRTFTHSILGMLIFIGPFIFSTYFESVMIGYGSHILADMFTDRGAPLFYPFQKTADRKHYKRISIAHITTGSNVEYSINFLLIIANFYLLITIFFGKLF